MSSSGSASSEQVLATVELLGALTYAQLRAFELTAHAIRYAPDVRVAHRLADHAVSEHAAYLRLLARLEQLTDLTDPPLDRQKRRVDDFFDHVPIEDWPSACAFFAIGLPMAADFARAVAPALDDDTRVAVVDALAARENFERFAAEQLTAAVRADPGQRERLRRLTAEVTGAALTEFQGAVTSTDALEVLLLQLEETGGGDLLRRTAVSLLEQHRRRMLEIGLDTPE